MSELSPVALAGLGLIAAFGAGIVRGLSGFGFSALTIAGMSLFIAPAPLVPAVMALEVLASLVMLRSTARDADPRWLWWLVGGNVLFVPLGVMLLVMLPQAWMRLMVGAMLLSTSLGLRFVVTHHIDPSRGLRAAAGVISGLLNGLAGSGGVAAAMLMTASGLPPASLRGTMISFLVFASTLTLICAALATSAAAPGAGLLGAQTLYWIAILTPGMLAGIWLGKRMFTGDDPGRFRRFVLNLLIVISGLGVARALAELMAG